MFDEALVSEVELKVAEVFIEDVGKGLARFDPDDVKALGGAEAKRAGLAGQQHRGCGQTTDRAFGDKDLAARPGHNFAALLQQ